MVGYLVKPATRIVSVDIPDPDNFLMILRVLKDFPNETVAIVLSPRPVSFKAAPYGKKFEQILDSIGKVSVLEQGHSTTGLRRLISPITTRTIGGSTWINRLEPSNQAWFYQDPDFSDITVREDTRLYLHVSAFRLIGFLDAHRVNRDQYQIYWDEKSLEKIVVGIRHAFHVPDFTYDFNSSQVVRYHDLIARNIDDDGNVKNLLSGDLREQITELCKEYVQAKIALLGNDVSTSLRNLEELIIINIAQDITPEIYVGGPFTEALSYYTRAPVKHIIGMGGFIDGSNNLFPNQFNFLVDMQSAKTLLELAGSGKINLTLLPTDCVKNSLYTLSHQELEECLSKSLASQKLFSQYYRDANTLEQTYTPFDWVLALTINNPHLFTTKTVEMDIKKDTTGSEVITFRLHEGGNIVMYWNDREHMARHRSEYLKALKNTFQKSVK